MGSANVYASIGKSVVEIRVQARGEPKPIVQCGFIIACKDRSAYVITDVLILDMDIRRISVHFPDGLTSKHNQFYSYNGILGIHCSLWKSFDQTLVKSIELSEEGVKSSEMVYVYDGVGETITRGNVTQFGPHMFSITNIADDFSKLGALVLNKNGMLLGICYSLEYHLSARSILAIADCIEASHNRRFTTVQAALDHLHGII